MKLEYSVHQHKGDMEKTSKWLERFTKSLKYLRTIQFGDFLTWDGAEVKHINNTQYKYDCC